MRILLVFSLVFSQIPLTARSDDDGLIFLLGWLLGSASPSKGPSSGGQLPRLTREQMDRNRVSRDMIVSTLANETANDIGKIKSALDSGNQQEIQQAVKDVRVRLDGVIDKLQNEVWSRPMWNQWSTLRSYVDRSLKPAIITGGVVGGVVGGYHLGQVDPSIFATPENYLIGGLGSAIVAMLAYLVGTFTSEVILASGESSKDFKNILEMFWEKLKEKGIEVPKSFKKIRSAADIENKIRMETCNLFFKDLN